MADLCVNAGHPSSLVTHPTSSTSSQELCLSGSTLLTIAVLAFLIPPLLLRWTKSTYWLPLLDGFALVGVGGIAGFHLLPEAFKAGGLTAGVCFLIGLLLPSIGERVANRRAKRSAIWLIVLGIIPHCLIEGAALGVMSQDQSSALGSAIIAHRLPVALFVFSMMSNMHTVKRAWGVMMLLAVATIFGFVFGDAVALSLGDTALSGLQALVGGTLLHVIFAHELKQTPHTKTNTSSDHTARSGGSKRSCAHDHHHDHHHHDHHDHHHHQVHDDDTHNHHQHNHDHHHHGQRPEWLNAHQHDQGGSNANHRWATLGALLGLGLVAFFILQPHNHEHGHHHDEIPAQLSFIRTLMTLSLETAPILVLAYVLAGIVRSIVTPTQLRWLSRGKTGTQALKGVAFGLPLPICSCGVLPIYETLIRRGVPATAALGFLVATPELGVDALLMSIPLLGWELTCARLIAAFVIALLVAIIVGRGLQRSQGDERSDAEWSPQPFMARLKEGIRFGLIELFDHTFPWVLAGLLAAAWLEPMLNHELLSGMPSYLQVPLFALIGIPLYVCASGSTPLAAIAIHQGVSPGAALAFLIAGPATNITTFGVMSSLHHKRVAVFFGVVVALGAIGAGLCVDYLMIEATLDLHAHTHHESNLLGWISVGVICALLIASLGRQGPRGVMGQIMNPIRS